MSKSKKSDIQETDEKPSKYDGMSEEMAATFSEVHSYVEKIQDLLMTEAYRVQQEREAFDAVAVKLKHVHFSSTIKLNVGGQVFTTSVQTLKKDAASMLHAMFSGRFDTKPSEDGSYFIDRDGTHFRYILNYLRTGKLNLPDDKLVRRDLLEEAEFYQIQGIVDTLKPKPFSQSIILTAEQRLWLFEALGKVYETSNLLYRATKDGWLSTNFHALCDNKGPTIVVIKSNQYVFGGFASQSWISNGLHVMDTEAFLFSLKCYGNNEPTKMKIEPERVNYAMYCDSNYGPSFGGPYAYDLLISSNPNTTNCSTSISDSYECPPGFSGTQFLTGSNNFCVTEMEVFEMKT